MHRRDVAKALMISTAPTLLASTAQAQSCTASCGPINVIQYGADPTGTTDSTTAFTNAIAAVNNTAGRAGAVYVPTGTYVISNTLNVPRGVKIFGDGSRCTIVNLTGSAGNVLWRFVDTDYSGLAGMRIYLATNNPAAVAIELYSNNAWLQWNNFSDLEIVGYQSPNYIPGQVAIWSHSRDNTTTVVYNDFSLIRIFQIHQPLVIQNHFEGNVFRHLHINGFGINANDPAVSFTGNACHFLGTWLGKSASQASSLVGFNYNALNCIFDVVGDIGPGKVFSCTNPPLPAGATANQFRVTGTLGVTQEGDVTSGLNVGTFIPSIAGATTPGVATYTTQLGTFQLAGSRVYYELLIAWTGATGSGNLLVTNLPYSADSTEPQVSATISGSITGVAGSLTALALSSSNTLLIGYCNNGAANNLPVQPSGLLRIAGWYRLQPL